MPTEVARKNEHRMRHGLRAGTMPRGCSYIQRQILELRAALEDAIIARHGEISLAHAMAVQTALRWERHSLLCQRWIRRETGLLPTEGLTFSRDIARASAERDKVILALALGDDTKADPLASYKAALAATARPVEPEAPEAAPAAEPAHSDDAGATTAEVTETPTSAPAATPITTEGGHDHA